MSGCAEVCVWMEHDNYNRFYTERVVTARKPHTCVECVDKIPVGVKYELVNLKNDDGFSCEKTCLVCMEIRKAFCCETWVFSQLWEEINEQLFPEWETRGPLDCLAKLETLEAREEMRYRYTQWQEARDA